jgi:FMN phosphatase YigB (HAD superfamily)
LFTASGEHSLELDGYLTGMDVRQCFSTLYGPDLIHTSKTSPRYYERIFAQVGIAPREALVVDDTETVLDWAADIGARTVLCRSQPPHSRRHGHVHALAELSELLSQKD